MLYRLPACARWHVLKRPTALILCLAVHCAQAAPSLVSTSFTLRKLAINEGLRLQLSEAPRGPLMVWVGHVDISSLVKVEGNVATYPADTSPLPIGVHVVTVWMVTADGTWAEVGKANVVIAADDSAAPAPAPSEALRLRAQLQSTWSHRSGASDSSLNAQGGVNFLQEGAEWRVKADATVLGDSARTRAIQFASRTGAADKLDIASYLAEARLGNTQLSLGHITTGQNALLQMGLANRGIALSQRFNDRVDATFSLQNGSAIVGIQRALGIFDADHSFVSATMGAEVYPERPGGLRFELSSLRADRRAGPPLPGLATMTAEEESRGIGGRLLWADVDRRARAEVAVAQSRYQTRFDPLKPAVNTSKRNAMLADFSWQLLRAYPLVADRPDWPLSVTALLRYEYADPLYKSLAASWGADYRQTTATVQASVGAANFQVTAVERADNVDRIAALLTNRMSMRQASLTLPLAPLWKAPADVAPYLPFVSINLQDVEQLGQRPPTNTPPSFIPNIRTTTQTGSLSWNLQRLSFNLGVTRLLQDNRQPGAERHDVNSLTHTYGVQWRPLDNLSLHAGFGPSRTFAGDIAITRNRRNPTIGFQWTGENGWRASGNYNFDRSYDSAATAVTRGYGINTSIGKALTLPSFWGSPVPVDLQLRHFITHNLSRSSFGESVTRNSGVVVLLTVNLF